MEDGCCHDGLKKKRIKGRKLKQKKNLSRIANFTLIHMDKIVYYFDVGLDTVGMCSG